MTIRHIGAPTRRGALLLGGGLLAAPATLRAQSFPSRPITIIVPFATGGYNDRLARAFAPFLRRQLGQPVTVVNRPGGGTTLGNTFFLQQPNDGYNIMVHSATPFIPLSILTRNARYAIEDFWMVNLPSRDFTLMATATTTPIQSVDEAIASLRRDPRSLTVGVQPASADLINLNLLFQAHGIETSRVRIVTYDGGGPARNAVAGGVVDIGFVGGEGFLPIRERIRPLMTFSDERSEAFPEAPTLVEHARGAGFQPEFVEGSQRGVVVATRLVEQQPAIYARILEATEAATKDPESIRTLQAQQLATRWYGPEASNQAYRNSAATMARFAALLRAN